MQTFTLPENIEIRIKSNYKTCISKNEFLKGVNILYKIYIYYCTAKNHMRYNGLWSNKKQTIQLTNSNSFLILNKTVIKS